MMMMMMVVIMMCLLYRFVNYALSVADAQLVLLRAYTKFVHMALAKYPAAVGVTDRPQPARMYT